MAVIDPLNNRSVQDIFGYQLGLVRSHSTATARFRAARLPLTAMAAVISGAATAVSDRVKLRHDQHLPNDFQTFKWYPREQANPVYESVLP